MACRNTDGCDGVSILLWWCDVIDGFDHGSGAGGDDGDDADGGGGGDDGDDGDDGGGEQGMVLMENPKVTYGGGDCKLHSRGMSVFERSEQSGYKSIQVSDENDNEGFPQHTSADFNYQFY